MMELTHEFTVPMSPDQAAAWFNDPANIAACFPGMTVTGSEGDDFTGSLRVALGPLSVTYAGTGTYLERGPERFVVRASGAARGIGSATVEQTAVLTAVAPELTAVALTTELSLTGRPAHFGYPGLNDVSSSLLATFQSAVEESLAPPEPEPEPEEVKAPTAAQEAVETGTALAHMYRKQMYALGLAVAALIGAGVIRWLARRSR